MEELVHITANAGVIQTLAKDLGPLPYCPFTAALGRYSNYLYFTDKKTDLQGGEIGAHICVWWRRLASSGRPDPEPVLRL